MINKILLTSAGRYSEKSSSFLGIEGENKANTLLFEFSDGFVDGLGQLYIERGSDIGYVNLIKNENSYELPVMSSLLSKVGEINMQVVITKADGTIIKYDKFTMLVKDAIDTDIPLPEEYPSWTSTISEMLSKTQDAIDEANTISEQLLKDKEDGVFNGKDGKDGKDGFSPIATVTQTDTGATISITDTNGTAIATVKNGKDGESGILEETDPVYSSEKSTLALKSELPTKLSQLQNDSEFITKTVNNLTNYYAKTETYTKAEINNLIGGLGSLDLEIVQSLPAVGKENTFYLLAQDREAPDIYDEYLYINGWEKIGSTAVDLTNYYTKTEVDNLIPVVPTKVSELENDSGYLTEYTETDPTIPTHVKNITQENITNWNNKSEFSGSYNDLTDKPTIPSVEGLATKEYVDDNTAAVIIYSDDTDETKISKLQEAAKLSATSIVLNKTIYYYSKEEMALYILNMFGYDMGYMFIFNNIISEGGNCGIVQIALIVNEDKTTITIQNATTLLATTDSVLIKTNTTEFIPTSDYHPATKKYVDDLVGNIETVLQTINSGSGV